MGISNSYNKPDSINQLVWSNKKKYKDVFDYYKGLIALRKDHPAFRMPSTEMIRQHLNFLETSDPLLIMYELNDHANGDSWKDILVIFNGDAAPKTVTLPEGKWEIVANENEIKEDGVTSARQEVAVAGISACILKRL